MASLRGLRAPNIIFLISLCLLPFANKCVLVGEGENLSCHKDIVLLQRVGELGQGGVGGPAGHGLGGADQQGGGNLPEVWTIKCM